MYTRGINRYKEILRIVVVTTKRKKNNIINGSTTASPLDIRFICDVYDNSLKSKHRINENLTVMLVTLIYKSTTRFCFFLLSNKILFFYIHENVYFKY